MEESPLRPSLAEPGPAAVARVATPKEVPAIPPGMLLTALKQGIAAVRAGNQAAALNALKQIEVLQARHGLASPMLFSNEFA